MEFRTLRSDEIELRVGMVKDNFYTLLLYKDARCDMNILDETVGTENWQRDHKEIKGNLYCGVGIWSETKKQWIWKWDCGVESNTEKEKGEASDSFKRACVNATGVGRELYTSPFIAVYCDNPKEESKTRKFKVKEIEYNEKREIIKLIIVDSKGIQVYPKTNIEQTKPVETPVKSESLGGDYVMKGGKHKDKPISMIPDDYLDWYLQNGYDEVTKQNIRKYKKDLFESDHAGLGDVEV